MDKNLTSLGDWFGVDPDTLEGRSEIDRQLDKDDYRATGIGPDQVTIDDPEIR